MASPKGSRKVVDVIVSQERKVVNMARTKKAEAQEVVAQAPADHGTMLGVEIPPIDIRFMEVEIIGDSPLIIHAWSEKAKREMLQKQMRQATKGKEAKDPWREYVDALYWISEKPENPTQADIDSGRFGFPSVAFKASAIDAAFQQGVIAKKTTMRGAFHIVEEYVEIIGKPTMREDMVRVGGISKVADIRYRPEFKEWRARFTVRYNATAITPEQILNAINIGGFANGLGEWRPSRDGSYGTYHVRKGNE